MLKRFLIVGGLVIFGMILFGTPLETTDNPANVVKKAGENYKMNVLQDTTKQVTQDLGDQAIEQGCKDPNSQMCRTTNWTVFVTSLGLAILFLGLLIGGLFGGIKIILSIFR